MKIQTRLAANQRTNLGEVLPLNTPFVLIVDPCNICNLRCQWCPSGHDDLISATNRTQTVMGFDIFKKLVDDSNEFPVPIRTLRMYKEGEPFLNPRFSDMVSYAKTNGNFGRIDTTTNGLMLNREFNRKVIAAGIDQINISVNGVSSEQIYRYTRRRIDFDKYVENIRDLYNNRGQCTIYVKCIKDTLTEDEQQRFLDIFGEISDRIFLERLSPAWPRFSLQSYGFVYDEIGNYGHPVENRTVCPYIFYSITINSDGSASTCVGDWKHLQILGDTKTESLYQIWNGAVVRHYWVEHLRGNKDIFPMCADCKVITHGCYDNIDDYAEKVLAQLAPEAENLKGIPYGGENQQVLPGVHTESHLPPP